MRDQLVQYVNLLFAGTDGAEDIKQEILQNTLDRYDDLIAQGKTEQAAYQLAISGIGDIQEILSSQPKSAPAQAAPVYTNAAPEDTEKRTKWIKGLAIACFILCAIPVLILQNEIGVVLCLVMVAIGVGLLVACGKDDPEDKADFAAEEKHRRSPVNRGITGGIWAVGVCAYLLLSFHTGYWHITWLIFPILTCLCGLVDAIFDLNKTLVSAIVRIIIFCIVLAVLAVSVFGLTYSLFTGDGYLSVHFSDNNYVTGQGSVNAQQVKNIDVEWVSGSITVQPGDTDEITFVESARSEDAKPMVWEQKGDTLLIQFCEPSFNIGINIGTTINTPSKDLVITVPKEWVCDDLTIESVSANIDVSELVCDSIDLTNVSGECAFINCNVDELSLETVSGGIDYRGGLNSLECNSVSADCEIYAMSHPNSIEMEGVSCDLILYLPESCGFTVETDTASGDFESDFATTTEKGRYVYGDGKCKINAESVSGDIIIRKAS